MARLEKRALISHSPKFRKLLKFALSLSVSTNTHTLIFWETFKNYGSHDILSQNISYIY